MGPLTIDVVKLGSLMTLLVIVGLEVMIGEKGRLPCNSLPKRRHGCRKYSCCQ